MINKITNLIKKAWRGEERLWVVFWVYFVLVDFLTYVNFVYKIIPRIEDVEVDGFLWLNIKFSFIFLLMILKLSFQVISIWRCAFNCNWKILGYISRVFIAPYALWSFYNIVSSIIHLVNVNN